MRLLSGLLLTLVLLLTACAHRSGEPAPPAAGTPAPDRYAPINAVEGRVILVREDLRYVVIDFTGRRMPKPGQTLAVVRDAKRVGTVRVGDRKSQFLNQTAAADISDGSATVGDRIRGE